MAERAPGRRGRPPIADDWVGAIRTTAVNERGLSAAEIARGVRVTAERQGRTDYPRERRVRSIVADVRGGSAQEQAPYRYLRWPDSFGTADLPWAAAAELLAEVRRRTDAGSERPTVLWATWWWRLRQSAPDAPSVALERAAGVLAALALAGGLTTESAAVAEAWLMRRGWTEAQLSIAPFCAVPENLLADVIAELTDGRMRLSADTLATLLSGSEGQSDEA